MLVLGATGHVGQAVVRRALALGRQVTAVTRQADPFALRGLDVAIAHIDEECGRLAELASGHDILVDAAAPYPLDPCLFGSPAWRSIIEGALRRTRNVLDAVRSSGSHFAFISSFTTLPRHEPFLGAMEAAWRRSVYPYFEVKAAMEQAVVGAASEGLPIAIVNPAAFLGPWEFRDTESSFAGLAMAQRLPVVMEQTINVIDVRDVALAIERALDGKYFGRPIPLAGHNTTLASLVSSIANLAGAGSIAPMAIDAGMASIAAFWTSAVFAAWGRSAPDAWRAAPLIADGFPMHPSPQQIAMGLTVRPLWETLRDVVRFWRK